ncbi:MAG TPA: hypothetical protein VGR25_07735 [bacterium]|jgi:hypothetical protein|nr:hypothetical protein [bacterium]
MKWLAWLAVVSVFLITPRLGASGEVTSTGKAADLRRTLNVLFSEHVFLATNTTAAALGGRDAEFSAAAWALDANSIELAAAISSVYGKEVGDKFLVGWRKHIRYFVDYTKGVAAKDRAKREESITELNEYAKELADFLHSANPNLPAGALDRLVRAHVAAVTRAIDAQGAKKLMDAYKAVRAAGLQTHTIADPIAEAIVRQFPEKFR